VRVFLLETRNGRFGTLLARYTRKEMREYPFQLSCVLRITINKAVDDAEYRKAKRF